MTVREALLKLLEDCDGATTEDRKGFNKFDSVIARDLSTKNSWTYKQEQMMYRMLKKYHRQLSKHGMEYSELKFEAKETSVEYRKPYLDFVDGKFTLKIHPKDKELAKSLPKAKWVPEQKIWRYLNTVDFINGIIPIKEQLELSNDAKEAANTTYLNYRNKLEKEQKLHNQVKEIKNEKEVVNNLPIKSQAFDHQIKAFNIGMTLDKAGLLMEQGTGKTLPAIGIAGARFLKGQVSRLLIIAPLSVLSEWKRQFTQHADFSFHIQVLNGKLSEREEILHKLTSLGKNTLQVILINYESTWRLEEPLLKSKFDMIICDESQKIKNSRAKQSKTIVKLGRIAKYKLILTGTPVSQGPLDFFGQYLFLDDSVLGRSFVNFRREYAYMGGWMNKQVVGYRNLEDLSEKVHNIAYRVTKQEALDLPETLDQRIYAQLEPSALKLYRTMKKEALLEIGDSEISAPIVLTKMLRLQQITGGFLKSEDGSIISTSTAKLQALGDLLETLFTQKSKIVIFARFIPEIEAIAKIAKDAGFKTLSLTGKVSQEDRESMINDFQTKETPMVFIAQIATGGVGITLTKADTAIFYSLDFSLVNYEQAKARIHRVGQDKKVTYIHLLAEGTLDELILEKLQAKKDVAKMVVDELKNIIKN